MSNQEQISRTGFFIALEGIDGSGKTTLSRMVAEHLSKYEVQSVNNKLITNTFEGGTRVMRSLAELLWPKHHTFDDHLFPPEYWLHLQVTWYSLLSSLVFEERLRDGERLLAEGWCYKFWAKMLHRGMNQEYVARIFQHVVKPDLVLFLDPPVDYVWDRKRDFKPHEMGLHQGYHPLGRDSFIQYQSELRQCFLQIASAEEFVIVPVSRGERIEESVAKVSAKVLEFSGW